MVEHLPTQSSCERHKPDVGNWNGGCRLTSDGNDVMYHHRTSSQADTVPGKIIKE